MNMITVYARHQGEAFLSSTQPPKSGLFFSFLLLLFSLRVNKQNHGIHSFKIQK